MVDFNKKIYNSDKFRLAAIFFEKHGQYTLAPIGTTDYIKYWDQETQRCLNGYVAPDGDSITGYHYFYLNYSPIMKLQEVEYTDKFGNKRKRRERIFGFPRFWDYDYYYFNAIDEAETQGKHMAVLKCRQRGYEQPYSELVCTPEGFVEMGSLKVGDCVMNPDGKPTKILEIFEQGFKDVYLLELADGRTVRCGADHLWEVICANNNFKSKVMTTHLLMCNLLFNHATVNGKQYNAYKYYLPAILPVEYSEKELKLHPYLLGALLGDGALTKRTPKISSVDEEILDRFRDLLGSGFELKYDPTTSCEYRIVDKERFQHKTEFENGKYGVNRVHRWLEELDLCVGCHDKYIPDIYKYGSVELRLELIRGLMDTDGYISKDGSMCFTNTSELLIKDMSEVLRSLGILCSISKRAPGKGGMMNGREIFGTKFYYIIYIKGNPDIFYLSRKRNRIQKDRKFSNKVAITSIKYLGEQERLRCIMVENSNHLYLTRDYIPTHNSFKGASMLVRNYELIPGSKNFAVASEQKFLIGDGLLAKAWLIMDFVDKHTAWSKQRLTSTRMERVAGYKVTDEFGKLTEQGYMSSITGITLKNDPERLRGTRGKLVLFEEGGKFPNLETAWRVEQPAVETDDGVAFGLLCAFGTGGTEGASFDGLKNLFYSPDAFNILSFDNIWDDNAEATKCGFFVPSWSNMESLAEDGKQKFMDEYGNSYKELAIEELIRLRNVIKDGGATQLSIDRFISERPLKPQEAVLELGKNIFPRKLLMEQLTRLRTNKKLQNMKHIVDLSWDGTGKVIATEKKSGDITTYHLKKDDKPEGSVVIWEYPIADPPFGLYIGGCLTPGQKVCTQRGLVNVEDVTLDDKLINKDGKFVEIYNLQRYQKVDELIYQVRPSNSFRTTTFTGEHPIYSSKTQNNFEFVKMRNVKCGDYIKIPNVYYNTNNEINIPFKCEDFWWFIGLWLGDGWCEKDKHKIYIAFDANQQGYIEKYERFLKYQLNKKYYKRKRRNAIEISFCCKKLNNWITSTFGSHADGKHIPDEIKRISEKNKLKLLLGYMDSDGCVYYNGKRNALSLEYVSINLQLLEDIQDLCFGVGIISGISKLRDAKQTCICGRIVNQKETYHLRLSSMQTKKICDMMSLYCDYHNIKLNNASKYIDKASKTTSNYCKLVENNKYIIFKIKEIKISKYTGTVYNFECDTHTYMCRNILTHNCDPYDHDESFTNSLGSTFIFKRIKAGEAWQDVIVAEYSGRPDTAEEYYENVRKLLTFYNARLLFENERKGIYPYFVNKHCDYLLADQPDKVISEIFKDSKVSRRKGCHMTKSIRAYGEGLILEWLLDEYEPGHPNVERIYSEPLIEELIENDGVKNVDRLIALCMVMIYREELYLVKVSAAKELNKLVELFEMPLFSQLWFDKDELDTGDDIPLFSF